jgi:PIN domain nuclease of toxin-antitoxin system
MLERGVFVGLLIDTQIFVWFSLGDKRLSKNVIPVLSDPNSALFTSAVVAFEFYDLQKRQRFSTEISFESLIEEMSVVVLDFPAEAWRLLDTLPQLHRDPVDRMLIAHAIHADLTLVTADKTMRDYPVRSLW